MQLSELLSSPLNKICVCLSDDKLHIKSFPTNLLLSCGLLVKQSVVRSRTSVSGSVICNVNNVSVVTDLYVCGHTKYSVIEDDIQLCETPLILRYIIKTLDGSRAIVCNCQKLSAKVYLLD